MPTKDAKQSKKEVHKRHKINKKIRQFAEEAWGNEPYGSNEPYESYEPYGRKTHKTTQNESKAAERSEAERKPRSGVP